MIIDIRGKNQIGAGVIDIYPGINGKKDAAYSARFTVMLDGEIFFQGEKWTPKRMLLEYERVRDMQDAFGVALEIVEAETNPAIN